MHGDYHYIKDIFEARKLGDSFQARRTQDRMRTSLGNNAAVLQHNHAIAQCENFFADVSHIEYRNTMCAIPSAEVIENTGFSSRIQCGQWFIEEQDKRICENNQAGVMSRRYEPGPYSSAEKACDAFVSWYLAKLQQD